MGLIQVLDATIAAQIAAGEVIERPVSVVKELLENALDAHADKITIDIIDGGMGCIRVTDNGDGIEKEDLPLAFERHATSKIENFSDLFKLSSYGFRGEALASISAISQVRAVSGKDASLPAWEYNISGDKKEDLKGVAPYKGTMIEVNNLFYNVPARRKFVRTNTQEVGRIHHIVAMYAIARPDVIFVLNVQKQTLFHTMNLESIPERMELVFGENLKDHLLKVSPTEFYPNHFIEAYLGDGTITRSNRQDEIFFINQRYVKSDFLKKLVEQAYYSFIPSDRFPLVFLNLTIPSDHIDVNVHPAKTEVKLVHTDRWEGILIDLLKDALWESAIDIRVNVNTISAKKASTKETKEIVMSQPLLTQDISSDIPIDAGKSLIREPHANYEMNESLYVDNRKEELKVPHVYFEKQKLFQAIDDGISREAKEEAMSTEAVITARDLPFLEPIGQLHQTFILAQNESGLYIIDQHTCHERILYERFLKAIKDDNVVLQKLLIPGKITLSPLQEMTLLENIVTIRDLGLILEYKGKGEFDLMSVPLLIGSIDNFQIFIEDILETIQNKTVLSLKDLMEVIVTSVACKKAVKAHGKLEKSEMISLLQELSETSNPHTCPHGRPIIMSLTMKDLYRYFKRGSYGGDR